VTPETPPPEGKRRHTAHLSARISELDERTRHVTFESDGVAIDRGSALAAWEARSEFRRLLVGVLRDAPFEAYFFELPALSTSSLAQPFEFVLIDAPGIARAPADPEPFREHLYERGRDVVTFPNLSGDATLVVPCPRGDLDAYSHFAAFVRGGPARQVDQLLVETARITLGRMGKSPLWLSTSGSGVSWLHVRLDRFPKYYCHTAYRTV
jgi:hypothetical protein